MPTITSPILPGSVIGAFDSAAYAWTDTTVVASSVYNDDGPLIQTLLLLHRTAPYFQVAIFNPDAGMVAAHYSPRVENIGRAVALFEEMGGEVYS